MSSKKQQPISENNGPKKTFNQHVVELMHPELMQDLKRFGTAALFIVPGIFVLSAALVGTDMLLNGRMMPGTVIGNSPIGFSYAEDSVRTLEQAAQNYLKTPITFVLNETETQVTPEELGIQFSAHQSVVGFPVYDFRKNSPVSLIAASLSKHTVKPALSYDADTIQNVLEQKLDLKKLRAQNAHIDFDNKKKPFVVAETAGSVLDKNALHVALKQNLNNLQSEKITITLVSEKPLVTAQNLESQKDLVANALKSQITLNYEGRQWKFSPEKHAEAISFIEDPTITLKNLNLTLPIHISKDAIPQGNDNVVIATAPSMVLDQNKIGDFLQQEIIAKIDRENSDVKIYTDEKKNIVIEGKGHDGLKVSKSGLIAGLNLALSNNIKKLTVPVLSMPANVTVSEDLQQMGIKNLIATGHSAFAGSHTGRIKNINVGISKYNGLLVKQGETFSFNDHLGPVDGEHGFAQELVIKAEGTVPEYGGGLCQVSSTLYRAALFAGFPIVERAPHSYAVSYYAQILGYGLDGTIYPGVHDVKFTNNSPGAIVMQSYTEGDQAYFKFYGTDDGRKVRLEGPYISNYRSPGPTQIVQSDKLPPGAKKQVEVNHTGFDVTWYRYIVNKDSQEEKETIFSRYKAIPAKIMVGSSGSNQASVPTT